MIEVSDRIDAGIGTVWELFVDLSRWREWNSVVMVLSGGEEGKIEEGKGFTLFFPPPVLPLPLKPIAEEVVPRKKIVLSGWRFGVRARHVFLFEGDDTKTAVTSRETFTGLPALLPAWILVEMRLKRLTADMLRDLKRAAEKRR